MRIHTKTAYAEPQVFSPEEFLSAVRAGRLSPDTEFWVEGTTIASTIAQALGGRRPEEADASFWTVRDTNPPAREERAQRAFLILATLGKLAALLMGCLPAIGGSTLLALFIVGMLVYGKCDTERRGVQERSIKDLIKRIAAHVDRNPAEPVLKLADLKAAGVVTEEDVQLLDQMQAEFHPVSAASSGNDVIFECRTERMDRLYYKSGETDAIVRHTSPDGRFVIATRPAVAGRPERAIEFREAGGRLVSEISSDALSAHPLWNSDGEYVAIQERARAQNFFRLWRVRAQGLVAIPLPEELTPDGLLDKDDLAIAGQWSQRFVQVEKWLGPRKLSVTSYAGRSFFDGEGRPDGFVQVRYGFELEIGDAGQVTVTNRQRQAFERKRPGEG